MVLKKVKLKYISQRKIYEEGVYNILTFTYKKGAIPSNALFGVKCGDLHHFKLTDRSTYGNVINPPKIYFELMICMKIYILIYSKAQ